MATSAKDVIDGKVRWSCECSSWEEWAPTLPDDSIDLLICSPSYMKARTYGRDDVARDLETWVAWMVDFVKVFSPKVKGLIAINCEGQTKDYRYLPAPFLLAADLHRAGFNLRKPAVFHRVGIPGSGGPDWLRNDWEPIVCVTRPGRLPFSDNTACGHPPKWAPGGEMSHMLSNGKRVNQWGPVGSANGAGKRFHHGDETGGSRKPRPSHKNFRHKEDKNTAPGAHARDIVKEPEANGFLGYDAPVLANPGNKIEQTYTASEVAELLGEMHDVLSMNVGGGVMGHPLSHENEAPYPVDLPAFFVKSFCPTDGITCDPFAGSSTTGHACLDHGRRYISCDLRQSQVELSIRRLRSITPGMFA